MTANQEPFWANAAFQPARKHRFRVGFVPNEDALSDTDTDDTDTDVESEETVETNQYWWWTQSASLPSFEIGEEVYQMVNRKFKYPGLLTWNDVQIVLYERGTEASRLMTMLKNAGYNFHSKAGCGSGILKGGFASHQLFIEELKPSGKMLQRFNLLNWYLKAANFGDLTYDDDGFVTITMTVGYDAVEVTTPRQQADTPND